jgi:hypothetical protein
MAEDAIGQLSWSDLEKRWGRVKPLLQIMKREGVYAIGDDERAKGVDIITSMLLCDLPQAHAELYTDLRQLSVDLVKLIGYKVYGEAQRLSLASLRIPALDLLIGYLTAWAEELNKPEETLLRHLSPELNQQIRARLELMGIVSSPTPFENWTDAQREEVLKYLWDLIFAVSKLERGTPEDIVLAVGRAATYEYDFYLSYARAQDFSQFHQIMRALTERVWDAAVIYEMVALPPLAFILVYDRLRESPISDAEAYWRRELAKLTPTLAQELRNRRMKREAQRIARPV